MTVKPGSKHLWKLIAITAIQLLVQQDCLSQTGVSKSQLTLAFQKTRDGYQSKDDLTGWIYSQLQRSGQSAAEHAALLTKTVVSAWRQPRTSEEVQAWQDLLTNQGYTLLLAGDIVHSTDAYTKAYEWSRLHPEIADETASVENILKPLGNNYTRLGDYEQALFIHQKALSLALAAKVPTAIAGTYCNLANAYGNMGDPSKALDYCQKGLSILSKQSALSGLLLSEQADAYFRLKAVAKAKSTIDQSVKVLQNAFKANPDAETGYWLFTAYQQAGDINSDSPKKALAWYLLAFHFQNALVHRHGQIRERERAKLFERLSALYAKLRQPADANDWAERCLAILVPAKHIGDLEEPDLYAENTLADVLYTCARLSIAANDPDEAIKRYRLYFSTEAKIRLELNTNASKEMIVSDLRARYEEAIGLAWENWQKSQNKRYESDMLGFMESSKAQLLLEEVLRQERSAERPSTDSLSHRIRMLKNALAYYRREEIDHRDSSLVVYQQQEKELNWELSQLYRKTGGSVPEATRPMTAGIPAITDSLSHIFEKDQAGRLFFAGSSSLYTIECGRDSIVFADKLPLGRPFEDSVRQFVDTWFDHGAGAMIDHPQVYCAEAHHLYKQLFSGHPLRSGKEYIFFTDGALGLLPVEALTTQPDCPASPADWPFVIRQIQLSYGWSLETMLIQRSKPGPASPFFGLFVSTGQHGRPTLAAVSSENEALKPIIGGEQWWTDSQATTTRFRDALDHAAIIHLSTHAITHQDSLDIPSLQFYDGPFYLFELQVFQAHPSLVFLNACKTADGKTIPGEGVQSMARAFTASGSNAVIAGWWNVNDETAAYLSAAFYRSLVQDQPVENENIASILRNAKLAWLNDTSVVFLQKLPYFWASLGYSGSTAPFNPDRKWNQHLAPGQPFAKYIRRLCSLLIILALFALIWYTKIKK